MYNKRTERDVEGSQENRRYSVDKMLEKDLIDGSLQSFLIKEN